ncbi:GTPase activating protein [Haplosporangium bisporale]|nr:GTPase activating protein [Haplosporangium bisporale]
MRRRRSLSNQESRTRHGPSSSPIVGSGSPAPSGRSRTPLPFENHIDPIVNSVKEMRWNILERFSQVARFSRDTATNILDHPITKQILPPHVQQRIQESEAAKRVMDDYDSARVYLAKWAATVADQGDRERRELQAMDRLHLGSSPGRHSHANDKRRINDHEDEEGPLGSFNVLDLETECAMIHHTRTEPLSPMDWFTFFDEQGRLKVTETKVREAVFRGGIDHDIRIEVWKFFLGVYPWDSTEAERVVICATKTEEYFALKREWFDSAAVQETEAFQEQKLRIEKDVHRTDRTISFFASETLPNPSGDFTGVGSNENLELLKDILLTYNVWAAKEPTSAIPIKKPATSPSDNTTSSSSPSTPPEPNLLEGYVQGMSDLLAPVFAVMGDEVMGFWAFVGLMEKTKKNFYRDQVGMQSQLETLGKLIQTLDPKLYKHLEKCEALNLFFCFRWFLIWFKREFEWVDIMRLWEVLFSDHLSTQFHLFVAMAILDKHRDVMMDHLQGFDEILKYVNDLSMTINLEETLQDAEILYRRLECLADKVDAKRLELEQGSTTSGTTPVSSKTTVPEVPPALRQLLTQKK